MMHILVGAAYFLAAKAAMVIARTHPGVMVVWFPTGIALAAMLILGARVWPAIFAGAFIELLSIGHAGSALAIAAGKTLEAVLGATLVNRYAGGRRAFVRARESLIFVVLAGLISTQISPTVGVLSMSLGGLVSRPDEAGMWFTWWLGDVGGVLLVTPFILLWTDPPFGWSRRRLGIASALLVALVFGSVAAFGTLLPRGMTAYPLAFLCMPALISAAYRLGPLGAATGVMIFTVIASRGTLHGLGPFADAPPHEASLLLLAYLGVMQVLILALAAEVKRAMGAEVMEALDEGILDVDVAGRIVHWNPGAERIFGWTAGEMIGQPLDRLVPEELAGEVSAIRERVLHGGRMEDLETVRLRKDGSRVFVSVSVSPVRDVAGRVSGTLAVVLDITERKRAGAARARLAAIVQASDDAIIGLDGEGRIVSWNPGAQRMFGFSPEEAVGRLYSEMVAPAHPASKAELGHLLSRLRRGESVPPYDIERETKGGRPVYVSASASAIQDDSGRFVGASLILRDITGRKLYEDALSRLASLSEGLPIPVIELDTDFRVTFLNGAAETTFPDLVQRGSGHPLLADVRPCVDTMRKTDQRRQITVVEHQGFAYERHLVMPHPGLLRLYVLNSACRPGEVPPCVVGPRTAARTLTADEIRRSGGRGG